ncbi:response regulator [Ruminococcus gauvreauii]|uniref:Stage 0 sporulation protein A homolog n=1 Tax=Ruminococcus gauvreauii TaxID=438033 RepID=A0ABY5VHG1_9FIRM|nr:response regulator [Ruminococcus gauvreauii]UWP59626.1 response regulator [Ruminococcus gauvreauii]
MLNTMTAWETLSTLCSAWFERRSVDEVCAFLDDEFCFVGTGEDEFAHSPREMREYLKRDVQEITEPFGVELTLFQEQEIGTDMRNLSVGMLLRSTQYHWRVRGFFTLVRQRGTWRVRTLWFAEPGNSQRGEEHYPGTLVVESIAKQWQDLLSASVPGGMMGGYNEEGFPFYFINNRMLEYLGYTCEEEFIADIGGMISNCIHPDDRVMVDREVTRQMADGSEYGVEYRMKKQDGSYIWVHDLGRAVTAENGRQAIISVCIDITAQKKAQDEVMHLCNNVPGAVFRVRCDDNFSVADANDGLYELLGYTREEFVELGNGMAAVVYPGDLGAVRKKLMADNGRGNTIRDEHRLVCKDGNVKWISLKAQLMPGDDGILYFHGVFVDITDEKLAQRQIRELYEKELAYFAQAASTEGSIQGRVNVTQDRVESYQSTDAAAIARTGHTYEQAIRKLADSAADSEYGGYLRTVLGRERVLSDFAAGKTDHRFEFLRKRKDGGMFWSKTNFRFHKNPENKDVIAFFYTIDMTEQKMQEQLLSKVTELDYEIISDIDIRNDAYQVVSFCPGVENMMPKKGRFQAEARTIAATIMDESEGSEYLKKLDFVYMQKELAEHGSYSFMAKTCDGYGNYRVKRFQVFYISRELGRVCIARTDVTDIISQEQQQKEALASALTAARQANAAKTDFLSRMSHEIRTPMNAIIGMSAIAAKAIGNDEQVSECISKIGISSRFLLSLINDILDMSRIESGKMLLKNERIPIEDFLSSLSTICYSQAAAKDVDYECITDPTMDDYYMGDAMKLQQVLINILSNAIKFTGEGGKVTFSVGVHRKIKNGAELRFIINDTGIGIDEEFLQYMFEPFAQESMGTTALYGGTGLGLAISKSIVDLMGGKIIVRSIKGIGSEFTVDVPVGITDEEMVRRSRKKTNPNFSALRTLVVDDDVAVCESAVLTLREMGVTAEWVDSGQKAIEQVRKLHEAGKYYDMILIDWKMPDMDGIETARRIRADAGPEVTIIIMTAYDWSNIEHEARMAGVNLLMSKPMFKSSLISAFSRALGEKEETGAEDNSALFDFTGRRVLLVEDNAINTEVAMVLLESKGFAVDTAENGLRAIEMFSKSEAGSYDAVLMDIRMPQMDGLTAANNIRHMTNADAGTIPIIAMTANAFDEDVEKSKAAGMNAHLAKPIEPERLFQVLHDFIAGRENE